MRYETYLGCYFRSKGIVVRNEIKYLIFRRGWFLPRQMPNAQPTAWLILSPESPVAMKAWHIHRLINTTTSPTSIVDPYHFDADPDSTYHPDADPDAGPDLDPSFQIKSQPLKKC
jgi:hypothetical protein